MLQFLALSVVTICLILFFLYKNDISIDDHKKYTIKETLEKLWTTIINHFKGE